MKLADYLIKRGIGPTDFAHLIHVRSRMTIHRYITGDRIPTPEIMARIERVTGGRVTAADFRDRKQDSFTPPKACPEQDNRKPYPWERRGTYQDEKADKYIRRVLREPQEGDGLSPPLKHVIDVLGERVTTDKQQRNFRLDHRPTDAQTLVRLANEILSDQGKPTIQYPGVNPIVD